MKNAKSFATDKNQMNADEIQKRLSLIYLCSSDFYLWQKCISSRLRGCALILI